MGTGHAVLQTLHLLKDDDINLIVNGDNPLLKYNTLQEIIKSKDSGLLITAIQSPNPFGCGRIIIQNNQKLNLCDSSFNISQFLIMTKKPYAIKDQRGKPGYSPHAMCSKCKRYYKIPVQGQKYECEYCNRPDDWFSCLDCLYLCV